MRNSNCRIPALKQGSLTFTNVHFANIWDLEKFVDFMENGLKYDFVCNVTEVAGSSKHWVALVVFQRGIENFGLLNKVCPL